MAKIEDKMNVLAGIVDRESKTYSFEKTLSVDGVERTGTFTAKYMGIGARLRLGSVRAKLLDGAPNQSVDTTTDNIAYMIAYLTVTLIKSPSWFNFDGLDEYLELRDLYTEVYQFMSNFREQNAQSSDDGSSQVASGKKPVESVQRTAIASEPPADSGN